MDKNCVIYIRVSDPRQVEGYSLDSQEELCRKKADQEGYQVIKVFREEGESAKFESRTEFQNMLLFCMQKSNNIHAVIVYSFSRFFRNTEGHLTIRAQLSKYGVSLRSVVEHTDETPIGHFVETIFAANAQLDNDLKSLNTANSLRRRFFEGYITRKPPIGYKTFKQEGSRSMAIQDTNSFNILQQTGYRIIKERLTLSQVSSCWNDKGFKNTTTKYFKKFTPKAVSKIYANKFYIGVLVSEKYGESVGKHEPMFTEDEFYQIRSAIEGRRTSKKGSHLKIREDSPLRGILRCFQCNAPMTSYSCTGNGGEYMYYICSKRGHKPNPSYNANLVEPLFIEVLKQMNLDEEEISLYVVRAKEKYQQKIGFLTNGQKKTQQEIKELDIMLIDLGKKNLRGFYSDEDYLKMKQSIEVDLITKKGLLGDSKIETLELEETLNFIKYYFSHFDRAWIDASPLGRYKLAGSMFPEGIAFDGEKYIEPKTGRQYKLNSEIVSSMALGDAYGSRTRLTGMKTQFPNRWKKAPSQTL